MIRKAFAAALRFLVNTLQNCEQGRTVPGPSAHSLLALVNDDPERAFKVLAT